MTKDVLLVHGLFGHLRMAELLSAFAPRDANAIDLLGYGAMRDAARPWSLDNQAEYVLRIAQKMERPHIVGHSVGGAVAALAAAYSPGVFSSLTIVEGNLTPEDAFWSEGIAAKPVSHIQEIMQGYNENPGAWFEAAGVQLDARTVELARDWLDFQPAETIHEQAKAVVKATEPPEYLKKVLSAANNLPLILVAGERSAENWTVPEQVLAASRSSIIMDGCGHLMMAEDPALFAQLINAELSKSETVDA